MEKQAIITYPEGLPQTLKLSDEQFGETLHAGETGSLAG